MALAMTGVEELYAAADINVAVRIANDILEGSEQTSIVLFGYDGRRKTIVRVRGRASQKHSPLVGSEEIIMALDRLPENVQKDVLAGNKLSDIGTQSAQYADLLKLPVIPGNCQLLLRGIVLDNSLTAILVAYGERASSAAAELRRIRNVGLLSGILSLIYLRYAERAARSEAVNSLQEITRRLHEKQERRVKNLEFELLRLQDERGEVIDLKRAEQLSAAATNSKRRAQVAERRLETLEGQIGKAIERLELAHAQIINLEAKITSQQKTIQELEAQLVDEAIKTL